MKLYNSLGSNTDGTINQKIITDELNSKLVAPASGEGILYFNTDKSVSIISSDKYALSSIYGSSYISLGRVADSDVGENSVAFGTTGMKATKAGAVAFGNQSVSEGLSSIALGYKNTSSGNYSFTGGSLNTASGESSVALGNNNTAGGSNSFATNNESQALGDNSYAGGYRAVAANEYDWAYGLSSNITDGVAAASLTSTSEIISLWDTSKFLLAKGIAAHAEGSNTLALGNSSHSEGQQTITTGNGSHAEGQQTKADGTGSHAEGVGTKATGTASHASGNGTTASGEFSTATGFATQANGLFSFTGGLNSIASQQCSFVYGNNVTSSYANKAVFGIYNDDKSDTLFEVGIGTSSTDKKNAFEVVNDGTIRTLNGIFSKLSDNYSILDGNADEGVGASNFALYTAYTELLTKIESSGSGSTGTPGKSAYESAVDNGFVGTETEWVESLKGTDGITPQIGANNNWFIGDTDTGVLARGTDGKDGKSIKSITKDENNNIITTFTDGTTQNIGQLAIDVEADFLTEIGFGKLRYYNGELQYYDDNTSSWIDTSITPDNVYIMNMMPQPMQKISCIFDTDLYKYKLKWKESADTIIDGQVACLVDKVIIRRKLGSAPTDENDGDLVIEVKRKDFGSYNNTYFIDEELTPNDGDVYYYKAFPVSTTGFYNYSTINETSGILCKNYNLFGFILDQNESDPASMITYIEDNKDFESAYMDYTADVFNYGDWKDIWFIRDLKPCMLKYDGTVDYELDKDDYTKKADGTDSDVANASYGGNAMVGIPKVYWKIVNNGDNTANIYFSDKKVDSNFHCWSHIDNNGNEIDYCYMPIYNGSNVNSVLRSISGKAPMANQTATTEITYAKSNNTSSDIIWYTELFNDRMLINLLLLLIGKSTDTQAVFGTGNNNSYVSNSNKGIKNTGTMNTKGLFWGNQDNVSGVKVFGIEHWYGNISRRIGGWINDKGTQKIKMTYGQSDGSTTDGYNETGSGYISIGGTTPSGTKGGYISKMLITDNGLIPTIVSGSATTYYCDGLWFDNSQVNYAGVGYCSNDASHVGAFSSLLHCLASFVYWGIGAALSCKPLAQISQ